jgi:hypothetical protein
MNVLRKLVMKARMKVVSIILFIFLYELYRNKFLFLIEFYIHTLHVIKYAGHFNLPYFDYFDII